MASTRCKSANQLQDYKDAMVSKGQENKMTTEFGAPMETGSASMSLGPHGPLLLRDNNFIENMAHFDRERIPERVVHAKGAGAFGFFRTTHDVTKYTKLAPFKEINKETRVAVRFSTVGGENGSADTARDPRGFAVKFYTEEGIWDMVGNNTPIFFIRDPILFPSFIHTQKRNPKTHLKDPDMFWDFIGLRPETTHQVLFLFSNRGTPDGYRHMNGYGSHTFKLINKEGECCWCKFHFKTDQGIKNFSDKEAGEMAGKNPDYSIQDLYDSIEHAKSEEELPSWSVYLQVMTLEEAKTHSDIAFDITKVWSHKDFPLIPVGKMILDRNPENYFAEVEQIAFSPAHMPPGVATSPDKMLQGRLFSYGDTHRHRLGANYQQLPVNCPINKVKNNARDAPGCIYNQGGAPNYFPNSFGGIQEQREYCDPCETYSGDTERFQSGDDDNFSQPKLFWRDVLNEQEKSDLISNMAGHMKDAQESIRARAIANFAKVDEGLGKRLVEAINVKLGVTTSQAKL